MALQTHVSIIGLKNQNVADLVAKDKASQLYDIL